MSRAPVSSAEQLEAVRLLATAPEREHWHRALLAGLRSPHEEVVDAVVAAALSKLRRATEPEVQDTLLRAMLDQCFLNLSGGPQPSCAPVDEPGESARMRSLEWAACKLLDAIAGLLAAGGHELECHRARLLAYGRLVGHMAGRGELQEALLRCANTMASGDGSDALEARELVRYRKLELMASPATTDAALVALLRPDRDCLAIDVPREILGAYRAMLAACTKEVQPEAICLALENLTAWLDQLPQTPATREEVVPGLFEKKHLHMLPPNRLSDLRVCRHVEAHLELVPGADHPEDLLRQAGERYDSIHSEGIFISYLGVLRRLPHLRLRSREIVELVGRPGGRMRSPDTWRGILDLLEHLLTGLPAYVLTREPLDSPGAEKAREKTRTLRDVLAPDQDFRNLLRRIATDDAWQLSDRPEVDHQVRSLAWRILVRCQPPDSRSLIEEGLLDRQGRFFFETLEEAAAGFQRDLWSIARLRWSELTSGRDEPRRRRVLALIQAFEAVRNVDAVLCEGERLGPMLRLCFEDRDSQVRERAERALIAAGFEPEVHRERQRRQLLSWRDQLTESNEECAKLEGQAADIRQRAIVNRLQRADRSIRTQELLQDREAVITRSYVDTARQQVGLAELRARLTATLERAEAELQTLRPLQQQMAHELEQSEQLAGGIERLVERQRHEERQLGELQRERESTNSRIRQAESTAAGLRREVQTLLPPSPPRTSSDSQEDARRVEAYQREVSNYQTQQRRLAQRIEDAQGQLQEAERHLAGCEVRIERSVATLGRLQTELTALHSQIAGIREDISVLRERFQRQHRSCEQVRRDLDELSSQVALAERRAEEHRASVQQLLRENTSNVGQEMRRLEQLTTELRQLSGELNRTTDGLDRQITASQRFVQAIDSGRRDYDRVGLQADEQSALADAHGYSLQERYRLELRRQQEFLAYYVESLAQILKGQPRLLERKKSQAGQRRPRQKQST